MFFACPLIELMPLMNSWQSTWPSPLSNSLNSSSRSPTSSSKVARNCLMRSSCSNNSNSSQDTKPSPESSSSWNTSFSFLELLLCMRCFCIIMTSSSEEATRFVSVMKTAAVTLTRAKQSSPRYATTKRPHPSPTLAMRTLVGGAQFPIVSSNMVIKVLLNVPKYSKTSRRSVRLTLLSARYVYISWFMSIPKHVIVVSSSSTDQTRACLLAMRDL
mmetsp:Transcript_55704/g.149172  ORF Transcript_55704/g.149172 Transcript_55704/m.149172 type:complete len:216 (-) Transcript_55704:118-765(-)